MNSLDSPSSTSTRLLSLDALRGFDMFWIMGADSLGHAFSKLANGPVSSAFAEQLDHVAWEGFRFYDLIFPLFVFMAGVAIPFSLGKIVREQGRNAALVRVFKRVLLLYVLGLLYYGGLRKGVEDLRLLGVLQRIALSYGGAAVLFVWVPPRNWWVALGTILLGYWAMVAFIPIPVFGSGSFTEGANLVNWIDKNYLPFRKWDGDHDPEGLLSTLPAIGSCIMGLLAGNWLKNGPSSGLVKVRQLVIFGILSVAIGWLWASPLLGRASFPVIKKLWTSSYVLVAGGYSLLLLGLFYWIIDLRGYRRWCLPFVWVGSNALFIYLLCNLVEFDQLAARFAGGDIHDAMDRITGVGWGDLVVSLISILLGFGIARFLYKRSVFVRI